MAQEKMKQWTQRCPQDIEKAAMKTAKALPDARALRLHKRNNLVNYLLEKFGAGKLEIKP